jgi:hypothetical protein
MSFGWLLLEGGPWGEMPDKSPQWWRRLWHRIKLILISWWWKHK